MTDPLVGSLSDRIRGRFGRRHPLMAGAAIPLAVALFLLFSPPDGLSAFDQFTWLTLFAILVRTALTFFQIPYLALGAEIALDYHQRLNLFAFGSLIGGIGFAVYWWFFPTATEFDPGLLNPDGYTSFTLTAAAIIVGAIALCVLGTAGEIPHLPTRTETRPPSPAAVIRDVVEVFRDRDFVVLFAGFILWYLFGFIALVGAPFMSLRFWGLKTEHLAWFSAASLAALPVAFLLVPPLTRAFDKKRIVIGSSLTYLLLVNTPICRRLLDVPWYPDNTSPWVLIINLGVAFAGGCAGTAFAITYASMCADLTDAHEYRTGQRREGALFAARSFANKTAGAMGLLIAGPSST